MLYFSIARQAAAHPGRAHRSKEDGTMKRNLKAQILMDCIEAAIAWNPWNYVFVNDAETVLNLTINAEDVLSVTPINGDTINDAANIVANNYDEYMDVWTVLMSIHPSNIWETV